MKKIKFLGAAVLAASLIFAGCSSPAGIVPEGIEPIDNNENNNETGEYNNGQNNNGQNNNNTGTPSTSMTVEFLDSSNTSTYANGVYTVNLGTAHDAGDEWGNQIWILNPNKSSGIAAGDKIHAAVTLEANKEIASVLVKDEFNHGSYSGIDLTKSVPANTPTVFDLYGTVADDYDDSARFVLAVRGNEAGTTLKVSGIKVEKIANYSVESINLSASANKAAFGEKITFSATDQYGIKLGGIEYSITTAGAVSTIDGAVLTAGDTPEEITVIAKLGALTSNEVTITVYEATYSDVVLFNKVDLVNELNFAGIQNWWGTWTCNVQENAIVATGEENGCFGLPLKSEASYKAGAKLEVTYTANNAFAVKPVKPDAEFMLPASDTENTVQVSLGDADKMNTLGIVFKSAGSTATITSIKIINE